MRVAAVLLLCSLMFWFAPIIRKRNRLLMILLFAAYLLLNAYETILRPQNLYHHIRLVPGWTLYAIITGIGTKTDTYSLIEELILNILLYVPLGYLLPLCFRGMAVSTIVWTVNHHSFSLHSAVKVFLFSLLMSGLTECIQLFCKLGLCEADDVINNCLGAMIGFAVFRIQAKAKGIQGRTADEKGP